jgi:hypothetical protein
MTHLGARWTGEVPPGVQELQCGVAQGGKGASKVPLRCAPFEYEIGSSWNGPEKGAGQIRKTGS